MEVSIFEARNRLSDLVKRAEEGEEIVLSRHGHAVAQLTAVAPPARRVLGEAKGKIHEIDKGWWKPLADDQAEAFYSGKY
jgi:prevent-host-death family protein